MILARVLQVVALVLTLAAGAYALLGPGYASATTSSTAALGTASLLEVNGPGVLIVLSVPVAAAILPLVVRRRALPPVSILSATLLLGFALLGAATIGGFYGPAALTSLVAAVVVHVHTPRGGRQRQSASG